MDIDGAAVQAMLDKEAIREVSLRYTRGIDRHDADLLRSAYHADACDDHGAFIGSGADFVDYANRTHAQNWGTHQHHVTNQLIDLDGEPYGRFLSWDRLIELLSERIESDAG